VGREKKGQAAFLPLVLLRGRGGRAKPDGETSRGIGAACPDIQDRSGSFARLPQGLGNNM